MRKKEYKPVQIFAQAYILLPIIDFREEPNALNFNNYFT
jgi:hypothetical protein